MNPNPPNPMPPYCGQNQPQQINVPARLAYRYIDWEEGPWAMLPYQSLYPPPPQEQVAFLPPPLRHTRLLDAMQTYPL